MAATSVRGRPSINSVGTFPSGFIARKVGSRFSFLCQERGWASNVAPTSFNAMWAAIELAPGAKYRVNIRHLLRRNEKGACNVCWRGETTVHAYCTTKPAGEGAVVVGGAVEPRHVVTSEDAP